MLTRKDRQERGQAILLMALALVGMLGFAAVALDGGNIYAEQRRAQSAADNAVLAAAYQYMSGITSSTTISNAAIANALANDYDNNSSSNWVRFYRPPIVGAYAGNSDYMQVVITERVPTALAHLVYQGPFQLTVSAVGYAKRGGPPVDGNAVVALNKKDCSIVKANGNGDLIVSGGGIFANSNGSECGGGGDIINAAGNGSQIVVVPPDSISVVATSNVSGGQGDISPDPDSGAEQISEDPLADLEEPPCSSLTPGSPSNPDGSTTGEWIDPGSYSTLQVGANKKLYLRPGLYCVTSSSSHAVDLTNSNSVITGTGVTIYIQNGGMQITQGTVQLKAPSTTNNPECEDIMPWDAPSTSVCHYIGIVFFIDRDIFPAPVIKLAGQSGWDLEGTIYAPTATVELDGSSNWNMTGQILADKVVSGGGADIGVVFDPNLIYVPPPLISLMQ